MRRRLTLELALLRTIALGALLLLLVNPVRSRPGGTTAPPLVLLDASLSMAGANGVWRAAQDTARHLAAGGGGLIWRFGDVVSAFDTTPPSAGQSRLAPALAAAAGRSGSVIVVSDGAISDATDVPPDLGRRSRMVILPRTPFFDAFVASVDGPRRVAVGDTVRLRVAYGTAGKRDGGRGKGSAVIDVRIGERRLVSQPVTLPDSGTLVTEITLPTSHFPLPGLQAVEVRLAGVADAESRDDARWYVLDVSPQPTAVVLGSPPGWEARFFAKTLADVAQVPVKLFVETEPDRWRDASTLAPVPADAVRRAASGARVIALIGAPDRLGSFRRATRGGVLWWPLMGGGTSGGDWYVDPPPASMLAGALAGVSWDSLPPATAVVDLTGGSPVDATVLLTARLARRGPARPLALVRDSAGPRQVTVTGAGLWRWGFRGGEPAEAYRALVAVFADWLLAERDGSRERFGPVTPEAANGMPLEWRWLGQAAPQPVRVSLESESASVTRAVPFDADGRAELRMPPGVYRWRAIDGPERGVVVVERYSDEWRPAPVTLVAQPGEPGESRQDVAARDQWWLFAVALAAFVGEWVWRRRQGLP